jgi:hypothetical protein
MFNVVAWDIGTDWGPATIELSSGHCKSASGHGLDAWDGSCSRAAESRLWVGQGDWVMHQAGVSPCASEHSDWMYFSNASDTS